MATQISTTIKTIIDVLKNGFKNQQPPQTPPAPLIAIGSEFKPGLSAIDIAGQIIDKKKRYGIPTTPLPSGAPNLDLIMETIRVETIIENLKKNASIVVATKPGDIQTVGYGTSVNNNFSTFKGYIA